MEHDLWDLTSLNRCAALNYVYQQWLETFQVKRHNKNWFISGKKTKTTTGDDDEVLNPTSFVKTVAENPQTIYKSLNNGNKVSSSSSSTCYTLTTVLK